MVAPSRTRHAGIALASNRLGVGEDAYTRPLPEMPGMPENRYGACVMAAPAIELSGIDKSFGSVHAKRGVSLAIARAPITGIVGENGAGKSTLMSILYGFYQRRRGRDPHRRPARAHATTRTTRSRHGIGMVHQHFMLVDTFTVLENIVLGAEGGPLLAGGLAAARAELERAGARVRAHRRSRRARSPTCRSASSSASRS